MKKAIKFLYLISFFPCTLVSQIFTIEDIEVGRQTYLKPNVLANLQWEGNENTIAYTTDSNMFEINVSDYSTHKILDVAEFNNSLEAAGIEPGAGFPNVMFHSSEEFSFKLANSIIIFSLNNKQVEVIYKIPADAFSFEFNSNKGLIAYRKENNIWLMDSENKHQQITYDSLPGIVNGDTVYRNEFGSEKFILWSPQGNYFAFYRKNESRVGEYPLVNINTRSAQLNNIRYPMAGMNSEITEVWIYSVNDKKLIKIAIEGGPEQYNTNITWSPNEKSIYIQHLNRDQNLMVLKSYSAITGKYIREYFTETDEQYVEPLTPLIFSKKSPGDFFYQSNRDGYNHIYYFNSSKDKLVQITKGEWEVTQFFGTDADEQSCFFLATKENPLEQHLYKLNRNNQKITKLTNESGYHYNLFNFDKTKFIDQFNSFNVPYKSLVCSVDGKVEKELSASSNPLANYSLGKVEIGTLKAADNKTDLYYRLVKPVDFDSSKRYPVVIYVYGGPHVQLITNSWMGRIDYLQQYLAQRNIISFTLDSRGSDNRGCEFEQVIYRKLGFPELEDQMKGFDYLKTLNYVDTSRIGVHGWSFGGYMTILMMLKYPEIFKVGVAGGPVTDWKFYEVMYGERYMDRPEENIDGYTATNLNAMSANLGGKLLVIHGALDPIVVWQNSLTFIQSCIDEGKMVDYFVYPLQEHNVLGPERVHLATMITNYLIVNL